MHFRYHTMTYGNAIYAFQKMEPMKSFFFFFWPGQVFADVDTEKQEVLDTLFLIIDNDGRMIFHFPNI